MFAHPSSVHFYKDQTIYAWFSFLNPKLFINHPYQHIPNSFHNITTTNSYHIKKYKILFTFFLHDSHNSIQEKLPSPSTAESLFKERRFREGSSCSPKSHPIDLQATIGPFEDFWVTNKMVDVESHVVFITICFLCLSLNFQYMKLWTTAKNGQQVLNIDVNFITGDLKYTRIAMNTEPFGCFLKWWYPHFTPQNDHF